MHGEGGGLLHFSVLSLRNFGTKFAPYVYIHQKEKEQEEEEEKQNKTKQKKKNLISAKR